MQCRARQGELGSHALGDSEPPAVHGRARRRATTPVNTRADTLVCIDQSGRRSRNLRALVERLGLTSAQSTRSGKSSEKGSSRMATRGCYRKARGETRVFPRGETATRDAIVYAITKPLAHCLTTRAAAPGGGTHVQRCQRAPPGRAASGSGADAD